MINLVIIEIVEDAVYSVEIHNSAAGIKENFQRVLVIYFIGC